ncbi:MAG: hypothetical protein Q4P65_01470 [Eubacteriales bacterium]|nr:hypothetical protein [Eubacteriales bacterium]
MKVIVIGSSHAGYEALEEMLQSGKDYQLQWYEQGDYLSFMS